MSDHRIEAVSELIARENYGAPLDERSRLIRYLIGERSLSYLNAADAADAERGILRVADLPGKVTRLATWLMTADIAASLDVLNTLAKGDLEAAMQQIEATP